MANDTHGENGEKWIGFDLDGTLAEYDGWKGIEHIGKPIKPMCDLIKKLHSKCARKPNALALGGISHSSHYIMKYALAFRGRFVV